jgi:hypothetical protein
MFYERIFRELNNKQIRYLVIGGVAVNIHGYARATGDLDIVISFAEENLDRFVALMQELGFKPTIPVKIEDLCDPEKVGKWKAEKHMKVFPVFNPENELEHIDIMIENYIDFDAAYERRVLVTALDINIPVMSINDLIETKKIAGRKRDEIDIKALEKIKELKNER